MWFVVVLESLDYQHYLPLFFDGLSETNHPYEFLARLGVHEMLEHGDGKILAVIPLLIIPIRIAAKGFFFQSFSAISFATMEGIALDTTDSWLCRRVFAVSNSHEALADICSLPLGSQTKRVTLPAKLFQHAGSACHWDFAQKSP
ncbi:unnamed protein product [Boreogadus saida]